MENLQPTEMLPEASAASTSLDELRLSLSKMSPDELKDYALKKSSEIAERIKNSSNGVEQAKKAADEAQKVKGSFFSNLFGGDTKQKLSATANALNATNNALSETTDLVAESIRFSCVTTQFSQVMSEAMSYVMVEGFKDASGNVQKLSGKSAEAFKIVADKAKFFATKQIEAERKQAKLEEKLELRQREYREQSQRLDALEDLLDENKDLDNAQQREIKILFNYLRQKDRLDKKQNNYIRRQAKIIKFLIVISILSFGFSIASVYLSVMK